MAKDEERGSEAEGDVSGHVGKPSPGRPVARPSCQLELWRGDVPPFGGFRGGGFAVAVNPDFSPASLCFARESVINVSDSNA